MPYTLLDDTFHSNRKIIRAGLDGAGLYARALSYVAAELTDGWVPGEWAREVGSRNLCQKLHAIGLWKRCKEGDRFDIKNRRRGEDISFTAPGSGFYIEDYLVMNPAMAETLEIREKAAAAGRKGAHRRWHRKPYSSPYSELYDEPYSEPDGVAIADGVATRARAAPTPSLEQTPPTPTPALNVDEAAKLAFVESVIAGDTDILKTIKP